MRFEDKIQLVKQFIIRDNTGVFLPRAKIYNPNYPHYSFTRNATNAEIAGSITIDDIRLYIKMLRVKNLKEILFI